MKFFAAILTLAALATAAPVADLEARVGGAVTKTTSSAPAASNTADCWYGTCGGGGSGGWKREDSDLEARVGGAVTKTTTSTAPASTNTADCWYGTCGGGGSGGWKRLLSLFDARSNDNVQEERDLEARVGGAVTKTTSTAPAASNTADCWYGTCGGGGSGGW